MSATEFVSLAPPVRSRARSAVAARVSAVPWTAWLAFAGVVIFRIGSIVDVAWHKSVGRDAFWTPGHTTMGVGGLLFGLAGLFEIVMATRASGRREGSARVMGLYGPVGAFLLVWANFAMLSSSPFDDWWHKTYGLDLNFVTPPHLLLMLGWFAGQAGTLFWLASLINRAPQESRTPLVWMFVIAAAIHMMFLPTLNMTGRSSLHTAGCYFAIALAIPASLIATGRASRHKWGCTMVGGAYMAIIMASIWVLPLFPAQPKIGPVYQQVTHLIPPQFPLLFIVPGLVADLLLQRLGSRSSWMKALIIGPAVILGFLAVQWPFASFLMSPSSRNWIFGTHYLPYYEPALNPWKFKVLEKTTAAFAMTMAGALMLSVLTTRLGLAWGDWMRRLQR
ncbi:MAG: hypothetical protein JOZ54_19185 [Acidobacteria bacterium]|nr:hypothetical protein [Acidobacteriota bacterium]